MILFSVNVWKREDCDIFDKENWRCVKIDDSGIGVDTAMNDGVFRNETYDLNNKFLINMSCAR